MTEKNMIFSQPATWLLLVVLTSMTNSIASAQTIAYTGKTSPSTSLQQQNAETKQQSLQPSQSQRQSPPLQSEKSTLTHPPLTYNPYIKPAWLPTGNTQQANADSNQTGDNLELRATLQSQRIPMVLVNDQLLTTGDSYNGYRLLRINEGKAVFIKDQQEITLTIPKE